MSSRPGTLGLSSTHGSSICCDIHSWLARANTRNTHGTGCALSAAIAAEVAKGASLSEAVASAKAYGTAAILGMNPKAGDFWKVFSWQLQGALGEKRARAGKP